VPERFDGIETRGAARRIDPEEQADRGREPEASSTLWGAIKVSHWSE
jgi:hypothetical protein